MLILGASVVHRMDKKLLKKPRHLELQESPLESPGLPMHSPMDPPPAHRGPGRPVARPGAGLHPQQPSQFPGSYATPPGSAFDSSKRGPGRPPGRCAQLRRLLGGRQLWVSTGVFPWYYAMWALAWKICSTELTLLLPRQVGRVWCSVSPHRTLMELLAVDTARQNPKVLCFFHEQSTFCVACMLQCAHVYPAHVPFCGARCPCASLMARWSSGHRTPCCLRVCTP